MWTFKILFNQMGIKTVRVIVNRNSESLLNSKLNSIAVNGTMRIININISFYNFIGSKYILFKFRPHGGLALRAATADCDITCFSLYFTDFKSYRRFSDNQYLLILHCFMSQWWADSCCNRILNLSFWFFSNMLVCKVVGRRKVHRKLELERYFRISSVEKSTWDYENSLLVFKELLFLLQCLLVMLSARLVSILVLSCPMTDEFGFFSAFYFKFYVWSLNWCMDLNEYLAVDNISWFVEREFCLKLDFTGREGATWIREI